MHRRQILQTSARLLGGLALTPWLLRVPAARAENGEIGPGDRIMGDEGAPVTIIEYASLTCGHCASFHENTLPQVKSEWIEAGRARLVFRHFPLDGLALRAAAVANCMEGDRFFTFVSALFRSQSRWAHDSNPIDALNGIAKVAGMDDATFTSCVENEAEMEAILATAREGAKAFKVESTPTFVINGKKVAGDMRYEDFETLLSEAASA
jgi:protein-disulfide isomerase